MEPRDLLLGVRREGDPGYVPLTGVKKDIKNLLKASRTLENRGPSLAPTVPEALLGLDRVLPGSIRLLALHAQLETCLEHGKNNIKSIKNIQNH